VNNGRRWLKKLGSLILILGMVVPVRAWGALALWYRLPGPAPVRLLGAGAFAAAGLVAAVSLFGRNPILGGLPFLLSLGALIAWWVTIEPVAQANWAPDVSRQTTGRLEGDILTLTDVRNFNWHADGSFDQDGVTRTYDLTKLRTLDVFLSYWAGQEMAHVIMSFGFGGGEQLPWSIEVRRRGGGEFSPLADLFKSNPSLWSLPTSATSCASARTCEG
jgi:hypothetical protein